MKGIVNAILIMIFYICVAIFDACYLKTIVLIFFSGIGFSIWYQIFLNRLKHYKIYKRRKEDGNPEYYM